MVCLLRVGVYVVRQPLQHGVRYAVVEWGRAPVVSRLGVVTVFLRVFRLFEALREVRQPLSRATVAVQHHVLHGAQHIPGYVAVYGRHGWVHDAHVQPRLHGMIEEDGVHSLPYAVVAAEGEAEVADAAREVCLGHLAVYGAASLYESPAVVVVLRHSCCHGEHVGVEDDVLAGEAHRAQQSVSPACHAHLTLVGVCLPLFVEEHHHRRRAHGVHVSRLGKKLFLAFLE